MLSKQLKAQLRKELPSGITFRGDNALWVKRSKSYVKDGEKKERTLTKTIRLGVKSSMSDEEARKEFTKSLAEACKTKADMIDKLSNRLFLEAEVDIKTIDATLQALFDELMATTCKDNSIKHKSLQRQYFRDTLNFFAEKDIPSPKISDLHKSKWTLYEFKDWCRRQVENRPMNMYGTSNTNSVNKRLGVWRQLTELAIEKRLLSQSDTLNPAKKNWGIFDDARDQSKPKAPLSLDDENTLLQMLADNNDDLWRDCFTIAIDTGVRHDGELNALEPSMINFGTEMLEFKRPKTKVWSKIPLTKRALEIFKRRRQSALQDENNKFFPVSKSSIRHTWNKYMKLCGFTQTIRDKDGEVVVKTKYQPYSTRHTFITRLVEAGVPAKAVMDLAGHKVIETTFQFYTHSTDDMLETAIESLEKYKAKKKKDSTNGGSTPAVAPVSSMIGHNSRRKLKK